MENSPYLDKPIRSEAVVRAASQDEGNRNAKRHGRKAWNQDDWNHAVATYEKLHHDPA